MAPGHHEIIESQNHRIVEVGKDLLRSLSPTVNLPLPSPPLHHVPEHLIQTSFKYLQGWRLNHFTRQPVPMLDNPFSEEIFPNIQSKPPLAQLEAISSRPITCYLGEETDPTSRQPPFRQLQRAMRSPLSLLFSRLNNPRSLSRSPSALCSRPFPSSVALLWTRASPSMSLLSCGLTSAEYRGTIPALVLLATLFLIQARMPLAFLATWPHCQLMFSHLLTNTPPLFPKPAALRGIAVAQVQDLALSLVEPQTIGPSPSIQPVQVPLQSLPPLQQINTPAQLGVICKLTEGALDPFIQIIDKDVKQNWPQHRVLGTPLVTGCQLD
ncbi:hypothetical protein QYF61_010344 [Mycteria americana]|uniref:Uncharacterized protein n=1 Tax=Mycteria americana TaxID=33587 RepID=A0AAN7N9W5_MYCAM|nr:hypothetical protein QYF61_010344 [Mycteria americana]